MCLKPVYVTHMHATSTICFIFLSFGHGGQTRDAKTSAALEECEEVNVTRIQGVEKWWRPLR